MTNTIFFIPYLTQADCYNLQGTNPIHTDRIQIGEVVEENGSYVCYVTFLAEKYREAYSNLKSAEHTLVEGETDKVVKFEWNAEKGWKLGTGETAPVIFNVKCEKGAVVPTTPPTSEPTEGPVTPPTSEPTEGPVTPPTSEPTEGPVTPPTSEPTESPVTPPTSEPTEGPVTPPTSEPTESPVTPPTSEPTEGPATPPTSEPTQPETPPADPTPDEPQVPETPGAPDTPDDAGTPDAPATPVNPEGAPTTPVTQITVPNPVPVPPAAPEEDAEEEPQEDVELGDEEVPLARSRQTEEEEDESDANGGAEETVDIEDEEVPLAVLGSDTTGGKWALLNLILIVVTALISLCMLAFYFVGKRREEEEADAAEEEELKRRGLIRVLSIVPVIFAAITFILTENISNPMGFVDRWTLLMLLYAVVNGGLAVISIKKRKENEEKVRR